MIYNVHDWQEITGKVCAMEPVFLRQSIGSNNFVGKTHVDFNENASLAPKLWSQMTDGRKTQVPRNRQLWIVYV